MPHGTYYLTHLSLWSSTEVGNKLCMSTTSSSCSLSLSSAASFYKMQAEKRPGTGNLGVQCSFIREPQQAILVCTHQPMEEATPSQSWLELNVQPHDTTHTHTNTQCLDPSMKWSISVTSEFSHLSRAATLVPLWLSMVLKAQRRGCRGI